MVENKKAPRAVIAAGCLKMIMLLRNRYVNSAGAFIALLYFKPDTLSLTKRSKAVALNGAVMNEGIPPRVILNKTEPLFLVKPLNFTFCQSFPLLSHVFPRWVFSLPKTKKPLPNLIKYISR